MVFWKKRTGVPHEQDYERPRYYDEGFFSILFHYMGKFAYVNRRGEKVRVYKDGGTQCFDMCNVDYMSMVDINEMVKKLRCNQYEIMFYHYKLDKQNLDVGLRRLGTDIDLRDMLKHIKETDTSIIQVYIEHGHTCIKDNANMFSPSKVRVIEEIDDPSTSHTLHDHDVFPWSGVARGLTFERLEDSEWIEEFIKLAQSSQPMTQSSCVIDDTSLFPETNVGAGGVNVGSVSPTREHEDGGVNVRDDDNADNASGDIENAGKEDENVNAGEEEANATIENEKDKEIPKDYSMFPDHGYDFMEDDFDLQTGERSVPTAAEKENAHIPDQATENVEETVGGNEEETSEGQRVQEPDVEATTGVQVRGTRGRRRGTGQRPTLENQIPETFGVFDGDGEEVHSEYEDDEVLRSDCSEGEDGERQEPAVRYSDFNAETDMVNPRFAVGQRFASKKVLMEAINHYAVINPREIDIKKNNLEKVLVKCKGHVKCPFYLYATPIQGISTWVVKTYVGEHNCDSIKVHPRADDNWIAKMYLEHLRHNPTMPIASLVATVDREQQLKISHSQAYRAKRKALEKLKGDVNEQFKRIYDYKNELCSRNPGTTFVIKKGEDDDRFVRCYICMGAMKKGFKAGCRKLIGIDGCFLKGPCGGQLLAAVAIDPNDCIYPYAWAYVQVENTVTWTWFLRCLKHDLEITDEAESEWTFISDRQKGLTKAMSDVMPDVEHRYCVLHLYNNFKKVYKGKQLKDLLWNCARARNENSYKFEMAKLKAACEDAGKWLEEVGEKHWCRAFFHEDSKCEILLNNICECFNNFIKNARDEPIITMFETIRGNIMRRIYLKRDEMERKCEGRLLCFKIQERFEALKNRSCYGIADYNGSEEYSIRCPEGAQYVVNIVNKTCTCRQYQLVGIPCYHAIAAIYDYSRYKRAPDAPENWVDPCYTTDTFAKVYEHVLHPIRSENFWEKIDIPIEPPIYQNRLGRLPKNRRKSADEIQSNPNKLPRVGSKMHCSKCGSDKHNVRTCRSEAVPGTSGEGTSAPKKRGRPVKPDSRRIQREAARAAGLIRPRKKPTRFNTSRGTAQFSEGPRA